MEEVRDKNIVADKLRLNQILLNILSNSVKFNKVGGRISLQIRQLCSVPAGCASYQFIIRDTGIGMKQEFVEQIFEAFAWEETATVSGIPGTGLGMSITKNIVDMMGGTIQIESKVGVGTEFTVFLTFRLSKETAKKQENQNHSMHFLGKTVLLAEDNLLNQEIAVTILEGLGLTVDVAGDGTAAVEKMKRALPGQYSLILMDIQMPVMDGYEATRQIRSLADPQIASVPIVAMTANAFSTDQEKAHACGMNGYLTKPISVQKMQDVLNRVLTDVMEWK